MTSIKTFKVAKTVFEFLTPNEKKILPFLIEAVKGVDKIFCLQENQVNNGANYYPRDAIKKEIELAAKNDPRIFSPTTVVKRNKDKKLIAVDYHVEYRNLLLPIAKNLVKAANICQNTSFRNYLEILADSLINGKYQKADIAWLAINDSNLDITIGPHERYLDKLFFIKKAYQSNVGIIDKNITHQANSIRDILYSSIEEQPNRVSPPKIVDTRSLHCLIQAGFLGRALFVKQHLPCDADTTEKYGSRILGFLSVIDYKFNKLIYPIFNAVFEKSFRQRYSKKLLKIGNYYYVLLTAIAQQLHRYHNSRDRLKDFFPIFDEANSVVCGIQHSKHLVLKGVIDQKELESILIAQICWSFSEWILHKKSNVREDYLKGDALIFNFLIRVGALQEKGGVSWPNFAKIFFEMENLSTIFTRILQEGTYSEAQEFLSAYLSLDTFKIFGNKLDYIESI